MNISAFLLLFTTIFYGTPEEIPAWYLEDLQTHIGVWETDNRTYKNEQEVYDAYAIEWAYGGMKNNMYGRLYGIIDGVEQETFWDFHQYWDPASNQVVMVQVGWNGMMGIGYLEQTAEHTTRLVQDFTLPDGRQWRAGHTSTMLNDSTELSTSFNISEEGEWTEDRKYTWYKVK